MDERGTNRPSDKTPEPAPGGVEELHRLLMACVTDYAIVFLDPHGRIAAWNAGAERLLGYREAEVVGAPFGRLFPADGLRDGRAEKELQTAARTGRAEEDRWLGRRDGTRRWCNGVTTALRDEDGRLRGFATVLREVPDSGPRQRPETPQVLPGGERPQQALAEAFADYTCVARFDGKQVVLESASEGFTRTTGYTLEEFNERGGAAFAVHPDDVLVALRGLERLLSGQADSNEVRTLTKGGEVRWLRYVARAEPDPAAAGVLRIYGAAQDVTERKDAGQRVREAEQRFRQLAESIQEVFFVSDLLKTQILYCSPAYEEIWGRPCEDLAARPWTWLESVHPEDRGQFVAALERHARGEATDVEYRIVRPDGSVRWVRERGFPVHDPSGQVYRVAGVADDVTERKRAEEQRLLLEDQLRRRNEELTAADRRKDEFLAMLAHELRNPLAPIRNALQIMKMPGAPGETVRRARELMERQVRHLVRLVDDLLDVSRIMRNRIELRRERLDLGTVFARAVETAQPALDAQGHEFHVSLPERPVLLEGDLVRLAQVVGNLLVNAAKYTDPGGHVWLSGAREGGEAVIRVRDTGIGIDAELLPRVFDLFAQADRSLARSQGGLGVGLTLVKHLVEAHGGSVRASSPGPGQGSEFVVRLPALPHDPAAETTRAEGG